MDGWLMGLRSGVRRRKPTVKKRAGLVSLPWSTHLPRSTAPSPVRTDRLGYSFPGISQTLTQLDSSIYPEAWATRETRDTYQQEVAQRTAPRAPIQFLRLFFFLVCFFPAQRNVFFFAGVKFVMRPRFSAIITGSSFS